MIPGITADTTIQLITINNPKNNSPNPISYQYASKTLTVNNVTSGTNRLLKYARVIYFFSLANPITAILTKVKNKNKNATNKMQVP